MASGIPTRRTAARRADENAPPGGTSRSRSTHPSVAAASAKPSTSAAGSSIPLLKRNASSTVSVADAGEASAAAGGGAGAKPKMYKKRSALGEVTNAPKKVEKVDKGKAAAGTVVEERKPQVAAATRRTRASRVEEVSTGIPAPKRKATSTSTRLAEPTRSRSTTSSVNGDRPVLKDRQRNVDDDAVVEPPPQRKKRKTSSPPLIDEARLDVNEDEFDEGDLADPAVYDEDGQEVLLSSGSKGTHLRSPKRARAKDEGWTDLDAEDEGDPAMVAEYVIDAFNYMMKLEQKTMPEANYMDSQTEIDWNMRGIVMDWLIEVHSKFRLLPETLFIATNLIDRFLSIRVVSVQKLQLVGITSLFVAAKYEEVICPSIAHFINMADGGYDVTEMLKAERYLLSTLDFDLSFPNPLHFLRRISKADGYDIQTRTVSKFLIEIGCLERKLLAFAPSLLAAAAMYLSRACLERGEWTPNLVHYSTYSVEELLPAAQVMLDYILDPDFNANTFFYKKYAGKKHMKSSTYVRQWAIKMWPESANGTSPDRGRELFLELGLAGPRNPSV